MFKPEKIIALLESIPAAKRFLIAYSGGLDSHVLLHALASASVYDKNKLTAVHINHGWHPDAKQWEQHCRAVCQKLNITYETITIDAGAKKGESLEAIGREKRYAAFAHIMQPDDCLLTAHHQDDQAETLLIQLFRGAGVKGLASMPEISSFATGYHLRPLLEFSRAELYAYARENNLNWIDDSSNTDLRFDRNYLRHSIFPLLQQRWPAVSKTLARTANHCADATELLTIIAAEDLSKIKTEQPAVLAIEKLLELSPARLFNVLRYWLQQFDFPMPSEAHLQHIYTDVLLSIPDSNPVVRWNNIEIRRYKNRLYVLPKSIKFNSTEKIIWDLTQPLLLPTKITLTAEKIMGKGIRCATITDSKVLIKFRQHGERFHPVGRQGSHPLKKLFQEWNIPPWQRSTIPLIYHDNKLIAVAGYSVDSSIAAGPSELGWSIFYQGLP